MPGPGVGRKVRDGNEARELLAAWSASDEPMADWCAARRINWYSLSAYKGWPGRRGVRFVELEVEPTAVVHQRPAPSRYRVVLGERAVEVDQDFDDDVLRRLVRVVEGC